MKNIKTTSPPMILGERNKLLKQRFIGFNEHYIKDGILYIKMPRDFICICDASDLELVNKFRWHEHKGYAVAQRKIPDQKKNTFYQMHQVIMGRRYIDHINGNGLDNRRSNLRPYDDISLNAANATKRKDNTTGYIGVKLHRNTYEAYVNFHNKRYYCGGFKTPVEAARARDKKAKELFGEFAKLNFPKEE